MCITERQPPFTSTHLMQLYYTNTRPSNTLYTIWTTPLVTVGKDSSAYVHGEAARGRNCKLFKNSVARSRYWMFRYCVTRSHWSCRAGAICPTPATAGDTACTVIGVLEYEM